MKDKDLAQRVRDILSETPKLIHKNISVMVMKLKRLECYRIMLIKELLRIKN